MDLWFTGEIEDKAENEGAHRSTFSLPSFMKLPADRAGLPGDVMFTPFILSPSTPPIPPEAGRGTFSVKDCAS